MYVCIYIFIFKYVGGYSCRYSLLPCIPRYIFENKKKITIQHILTPIHARTIFVSLTESACLYLTHSLSSLNPAAYLYLSYQKEDTCHMRRRIHVICGGGYMSYEGTSQDPK